MSKARRRRLEGFILELWGVVNDHLVRGNIGKLNKEFREYLNRGLEQVSFLRIKNVDEAREYLSSLDDEDIDDLNSDIENFTKYNIGYHALYDRLSGKYKQPKSKSRGAGLPDPDFGQQASLRRRRPINTPENRYN